MDIEYLNQDIDALETQLRSGVHVEKEGLLSYSHEVETEARRLQNREVIAKVLLQRADILMTYEDPRGALASLENAERTLDESRPHDQKVKIAARKVDALTRLEDWPAVMAICEDVIPRIEKYRHNVNGIYLQSSYLRSRIGVYSHGIRAAFMLGDPKRMLKWAELSKCQSIFRLRNSESERFAATGTAEEFQRVSRQLDVERARFQDEDSEIIRRLRRKRRILSDLMLMQRVESVKGRQPPEFCIDLVRALLSEDEAVVYYYWLDRQTLLITVITREQCQSRLQPVSKDDRGKLDAFVDLIMTFDTKISPNEFDNVQQFADILLPGWLEPFCRNRTRLLLSPHRLLHAIPFHALRWNNGDKFLIQQFAVTNIPNLSSLLLGYSVPKKPRVLAIGIRNFRVPGQKLAPLGDAEDEVHELQQRYSERKIAIDARVGPKANHALVDDLVRSGDLHAYTCIHVASHGMNVNTESPMESQLYLYDSVLDGLEIGNWPLDATSLVVLSGCSTGQRAITNRRNSGSNNEGNARELAEELPGDDLFGLQAAFFAAGAKQVLGSLWPVWSNFAKDLMVKFHINLTEGQSPDIALQKALCEHLDTVSIRHFRKVFYWAPFFLTAAGRLEH